MTKVKFEDVATRVNTREDRLNTSLLYYVGGEHIESNEMLVQGCGLIKGSTIGPMFYCGFKKGDILLVSRNPHLRKASMVEFDGICSEKTFVLGTKDSKVLLQEFLALVMQSDDFWNYCEEHKSGGVNYFLNWSTLAKYEFYLPSIQEQKEIADKVWSAYRLKESYKKLLVATDEMVKSQFIEMFGNPFEINSEVVPLSSLCSINPSKPKGLDDSLSVSFIPMDRISEDGEYAEFETKPLKDVKKGFTYCAEDDVLFAKITPCMENGKGAILKGLSNGIGFGSTEFHVLRPILGISNSEWLYFLTKLNGFRIDAAKNMTGTGGQKRVPSSYLLNFKVLKPQLEVQREFAKIVHQADKSKFGDFKSQFIEMFGDPMTNTKAWVEFGYIGNYTQIVLGTTPNSKNSSYWNGEIKWITPAEMTEESYYIYDTERHLTEEGLKAANLTLLPCRSVLFSTRAPIGKVGLVGSPMYCNQGFKNFVCGDQLNPVYLYYSLIFKREYLVSLGTGTTFKELSKKAVENLKIAVPPLILQNKFEEIYQQADKSKSVIQKALVYLNDIQSDELGKIA